MGPFDPAQVQIHDFNTGDLNDPGLPDHFVDGGLFWTGHIPRSSAKLLGSGAAEMSLTDYPVLDFINVVNTILRPAGHPRDPSRASIDVAWTPTGETREVSAPRHSGNGRFAGKYWQTNVDIDWSAKNLATGYELSTVGSTSRTVTSQFSATIRNGIFA